MIINVFLRHKSKRIKIIRKKTIETNLGSWKAGGMSDFRELRKGNPRLTVGKEKNNLIFTLSPQNFQTR